MAERGGFEPPILPEGDFYYRITEAPFTLVTLAFLFSITPALAQPAFSHLKGGGECEFQIAAVLRNCVLDPQGDGAMFSRIDSIYTPDNRA